MSFYKYSLYKLGILQVFTYVILPSTLRGIAILRGETKALRVTELIQVKPGGQILTLAAAGIHLS